jgi:hypothetical protein
VVFKQTILRNWNKDSLVWGSLKNIASPLLLNRYVSPNKKVRLPMVRVPIISNDNKAMRGLIQRVLLVWKCNPLRMTHVANARLHIALAPYHHSIIKKKKILKIERID